MNRQETKNGSYEVVVRKATMEQLDEMDRLYQELHDYLEANTNYPRWLTLLLK